jgi:hypothetical protein
LEKYQPGDGLLWSQRRGVADSMRTRTTTILLTMVTGVLTITPLFSQLDTDTISGRVTDASGAVVPGAQVVVVNTQTKFENVTISNADGQSGGQCGA